MGRPRRFVTLLGAAAAAVAVAVVRHGHGSAWGHKVPCGILIGDAVLYGRGRGRHRRAVREPGPPAAWRPGGAVPRGQQRTATARSIKETLRPGLDLAPGSGFEHLVHDAPRDAVATRNWRPEDEDEERVCPARADQAREQQRDASAGQGYRTRRHPPGHRRTTSAAGRGTETKGKEVVMAQHQDAPAMPPPRPDSPHASGWREGA
jgi:hypothetical protein